MIINVPKSIMVGGHEYSISLRPMLHELLWGEHSYPKAEITVATEGADRVRAPALIHELTHAIGYIYCGDALDERAVASLAEGIYQIIQQLGIELCWDGVPVLESDIANEH
jgi:hypothetical protein